MFAVQCSFCQHENIPGARFCAECGSPLHLRVCPNPQCGKVSDVNASRCEHCGTPFPKIALAEPGVASPVQPSATATSAGVDGKKGGMSAWPLIIVAIVAGGLPLLWFNRTALPTPKTWQSAAEAERSAQLPVPQPSAPVAANAPLQSAASAPAPSAGAEALTLPPLSAAVPPTQVDKNEAAAPEAPEPTGKPVEATPSPGKTKEKSDASAKKTKTAAAPEASEPPRPCTEAAAALGLCDPPPPKKQ